MTAAEKAKQLYDEYGEYLSLPVVDEIIFAVSHGIKYEWSRERRGGENNIVYWAEVKRELIKSTNKPPRTLWFYRGLWYI